MSDKDDADQLYKEAHKVKNQFHQYVFLSTISFSYIILLKPWHFCDNKASISVELVEQFLHQQY